MIPDELINSLTLTIPYITRGAGGMLFVVIGWIAAAWLKRLIRRVSQDQGLDPTLTSFAASAARYAVVVMTLLSALSLFGIETTSFTAVIGATSLAVGLALQGTLSNLASGLLLIGFRPFRVGDFIRSNGESGTVEEITLFTTILRTVDNRVIIIPNGPIFSGTIENITLKTQRRVDVAIGVGYDADLKKTREVLHAVYADLEEVLTEDKGAPSNPVVALTNLGPSSVDWSIRVWCSSDKYWVLREQLLERTKTYLDEAGINIPYPQMDVHLKTPRDFDTPSSSKNELQSSLQ